MKLNTNSDMIVQPRLEQMEQPLCRVASATVSVQISSLLFFFNLHLSVNSTDPQPGAELSAFMEHLTVFGAELGQYPLFIVYLYLS